MPETTEKTTKRQSRNSKVVSISLPEDLLRDLTAYCEVRKLKRSRAIAEMIAIHLEESANLVVALPGD